MLYYLTGDVKEFMKEQRETTRIAAGVGLCFRLGQLAKVEVKINSFLRFLKIERNSFVSEIIDACLEFYMLRP